MITVGRNCLLLVGLLGIIFGPLGANRALAAETVDSVNPDGEVAVVAPDVLVNTSVAAEPASAVTQIPLVTPAEAAALNRNALRHSNLLVRRGGQPSINGVLCAVAVTAAGDGDWNPGTVDARPTGDYGRNSDGTNSTPSRGAVSRNAAYFATFLKGACLGALVGSLLPTTESRPMATNVAVSAVAAAVTLTIIDAYVIGPAE